MGVKRGYFDSGESVMFEKGFGVLLTFDMVERNISRGVRENLDRFCLFLIINLDIWCLKVLSLLYENSVSERY